MEKVQCHTGLAKPCIFPGLHVNQRPSGAQHIRIRTGVRHRGGTRIKEGIPTLAKTPVRHS